MFCHKCGNQVAEDSAFCPKCGAKIKNDGGLQQVPTSATAEQGQPRTNDFQSVLPQKKKLGKIPMIIGGVALVIIIAIVIAMNWNGKIDYEATVRAHQPFAFTQELPYTYEEVLDKYISSPDWKVRKSGDVNYVDVSGKAKGTDNELSVTIKVTEDSSDPDLAKIAPESVAIDGKKSPTQNDAVEFLLAMFLMYEEKYDDISELFSETVNPSGDQIMIGETQSYDNEFGNMEVTLDYIEFIDKIENPLLGGYNYPDEGSVFLRAAFTLKNIGTEKGSLITAWSAAVYDSMYEFKNLYTEGVLTDINPLTPPATGSIIFMVPNDVVESDKSLVININDGSGASVISYVIRPAANTSGQSQAGNTNMTYLEQDSLTRKGHDSTLILYSDGSFDFNVSVVRLAQVNIHGTYNMSGDTYNFESQSIEGPAGMEEDKNLQKFTLIISGDELIYSGDWFGLESLTLARTSSGNGTVSGTVSLSHDDAYDIAKAWLDAHPAMATPYEPTTIREASDVMFVHNGEEYYSFYLNGYYWLDILVHSKTGELLCAVHEESDEQRPPEIEQLDDYYNRFYGD